MLKFFLNFDNGTVNFFLRGNKILCGIDGNAIITAYNASVYPIDVAEPFDFIIE